MNRCFLILGLFLVSLAAVSQSTNATISGGVTDTSGNFIVDADVEIANDSTGIVYSARTNSLGMYLLPILPPGHYHVQVSKLGFRTIIKADVTLNVQSAVALNFTLPIGATSESVTVDAATSEINTTDASVSTVVDRKFVENMPLNGRSFQDLISMTPGVVTQSPQSQAGTQLPGDGGDFSVNGQRTESNYYTVDGVSANVGAGYPTGNAQAANGGTISASTALGTTQSLVSVEALQEFRVSSSSYSAEYGRSPGGQFSFLTRSGTNEFHGVAFDYLRNNVFDANDWFNNHYDRAQPALRQNDFGGTLGGPVDIPGLYRGTKRTFFFVSYEGLRLTQPQSATIQYVPDAQLRASASPILQPILNSFPAPSPDGIDYPAAGLQQFIEPYSTPSTINNTSVRIDHNLLPNLAVFFRFSDSPSSATSRSLSSFTVQSSNTQTYTWGSTAQLTRNWSNELRLGFTKSTAALDVSLDNFGGATPTNLAQALGIGAYPTAHVLFYMNIPLGNGSTGTSALSTENTSNSLNQWNLVDNVSTVWGHHQIKLGGDYRHLSSPINPTSPYLLPYFTSLTSLVTDNPVLLDLFKSVPATPVFNELALFVQDDWKVAPAVSLSLGLRWEVDPPPTEAHGNDAYTLLGNVSDPGSLALAPQGTPLWQTPKFNFAPRLGVAWTANNRPGRETVLRGGGGVFFDTANELATQGYNGIGFQALETYFGSPLPVTSSQLDFSPSVSSPYTNSTIYAFPQHLQLPYTLQWNVSLEQALDKNQAMTLSYVGSNGRRLIQEQEYSIQTLNPDFGTVILIPDGITSNYQSLQAKFQRSISKGLQALVSYTWSHSLDFGSNNASLPLTRGNSDFDVRHNFQAGMSWDAPTPHLHSMISPALSNWAADIRAIARTSYPVTLAGSSYVDPATGNTFFSGLNLVPGQPTYLYGMQYPGGREINPGAFSTPSVSSVGDAPRNFARGFGEFQLNFAARRQFHLTDALSLQFRAEAFNVLNRANFGTVDPLLTDTTFGQATQMLNQSLGTVAAQYQQGGPRSMQFALKLRY
ncbi:MAG TPA: TonB-dependent receptor [Terracidiphilus sp.]